MSDQPPHNPIWGTQPPPPPPQQRSQPPPQRHIGQTTSLVLLSLIGLLVVVGVIASRSSQGAPQGTHQVRYEVAGDGLMAANVTFQNEGGDTAQQNGQQLPWVYTMTASSGAFLYVSAQNQSDSGIITCTIEVDGQTAKSSTSSGGYAICQASGRL